MITRTLNILLIATLLNGCSFFDPEKNLDGERELWEKSQGHLDGKRYLEAITLLEEMDRRFPFGRYAESAQLDLIYTYFKASKYDLSRLTADRFIRLNPLHPEADYAQYMKGLSRYASNESFFTRYLPGDETGRDIGDARNAISAFKTLLEKYPESQFSGDSTLRLIYVRNRLAEYEIHVARHYIRKGAYLAAANRARQVIESYPSTSAVIDALIIMYLSYEALGLPNEAQDALFVLSTNHPQYVAGPRHDQRLAPGILYSSDKMLTRILTLGLVKNRMDLASRLVGFSERRRNDMSQRLKTPLPTSDKRPATDAPRVVNEVFF